MRSIKKLKTGSFWLFVVEQVVYLCPTLITVLYYYFSEIEKTVSWSSKMSFGLAISVLVLFIIYRKAFKTKLSDMHQGLVQSETDLKNGVGDPEKITANIARDRITLDSMGRMSVLISLVVVGLSIYILEQAMIGLATLVFIAIGSVLVGMGIHIGAIKLERKEKLKEVGKDGSK